MRIPPVLFGVPFVAAGILLPALATPLDAPGAAVIAMEHEGYVVDGVPHQEGVTPVIEIGVNDTLTFQNNSRWIHIVSPGVDGMLATPGAGSMTPRLLMSENDTYTTEPWRTAGEYLITCTVHPEMNAKVVVH